MSNHTLTISCLPAFEDNYIWLLNCGAHAVVIDPGQAEPVLRFLDAHPMQLEAILITHQHRDHTDGALALQARTGCTIWAPSYLNKPDGFTVVRGGDTLHYLGLTFEVLATPGHTAEHLGYLCRDGAQNHFFCGDTLFSAGCGRPFLALGGSSRELFHTFQNIKTLESNTLIYPAHEYTLSNVEFALSLEPNNEALSDYHRRCLLYRQSGLATLPTSLEQEWQVNPFLWVQDAAAFHDLRERKNQF